MDSGFPQMMAGNDREKWRLQEEVWSLRVRTIGVQLLLPLWSTVLLSQEGQLNGRPVGDLRASVRKLEAPRSKDSGK